MKTLHTHSLLLGLVVSCSAACGGGGGGGGPAVGGGGNPPPMGNLSPGGFYRGMITGCSSVCPVEANMLIAEDGEWVGMDPVYTAGANAGQITMNGSSVSSTREFYNGSATAFGFRPGDPARTDGSGDDRSFRGTVEERQKISGSFVHNSSSRTQIDVDYDQSYEADSSLATIAGMYSATDGSGFALTYTIDANGVLSGSDTDGCVASGEVRIIDGQYNMYRFVLDFSACPTSGAQGSHHGVGSLLDGGSGTIDTLLFSALAESAATLVILELTKL